MLEIILQRAFHYAGRMTWVDVLDIAFIGAFISIASVWLRRRTARAVLFALVPLLVTYTAARELRMYLTSTLFEYGLIALFVSIVVIFQEDFRRAFESMASWRPWGRRRVIQPAKFADVLVESMTKLAETKTGALIVLQGQESIEPHVRSGIPLHGTLSVPLLLSIFDPHSPGHDGGVTIADGRIVLFGAHLPLSRDAHATGRLGTRHAAALGLVEKCDALVLVVSEERGTTSLAQNGKLRVSSIEDIREAIVSHFRRLGSNAPHRRLWEIPWFRLVGSYSLAMVLWLVFARPVNLVARTIDVSIVSRGLPKGWEASHPEPKHASVTIVGPELPVMQIEPSYLALAVDLSRVTEGKTRFALRENDLQLPPHIRVKRIEPPDVFVHTYQTRDVQIPISLQWMEGRRPNAGSVRLSPAEVIVKLPKNGSTPETIETYPVDPRDVKPGAVYKAKLRAPHQAELSISDVEISLAP